MAKLTAERWLQAGFEALDAQGHEAVSAQALARRLCVTRGSFYHHFASRRAFVAQLLQRWEDEYTSAVLAAAQAAGGPQAQLQRYVAIAARLQPGREVAIRAWSAKDKQVHAVLQRVEARRLAFARTLAAGLLAGSERAADVEAFARMAYLGFIGLQQAAAQGEAPAFAQFFADLQDLGRRALARGLGARETAAPGARGRSGRRCARGERS
jgi:AcrR family transcriptional regulator